MPTPKGSPAVRLAREAVEATSKQDVADRTGASVRTVEGWIQGRPIPRRHLDTLRRMRERSA